MHDEDELGNGGAAVRVGSMGLWIAWLSRALSQVSWAVTDQGLVGIGNFAAAVLLARWFTPAEYGGYTAASAVFWMVVPVYYGLLTEPMMLFATVDFHDRLPSYFSVLSVFHWCLSGVMAVGFAAAGLLLLAWGLMTPGLSLLGYALAAPLFLMLSPLRRIFYVRSAPRLSAGANGVYMVSMLAIMYLLYQSATLSTFTAPLAIGGASALAIAAIIAVRRFGMWPLWTEGGFVRQVARAHWRYGRWLVLVTALEGFPGYFFFLILPSLVGPEANAALRALTILTLPAIQINVAFSWLLVPALGRVRLRGGDISLVWKALIVFVLGGCVYAIVVAEVGRPAMDLMYRGRYTEYAQLAWLVGLTPIPVAALSVLASAFRAYERLDLAFRANLISTAVICVFGSAAVAIWGLRGAILGLLGGNMTTMVVMLFLVHRLDFSRDPGPQIGPAPDATREQGA